MPRSTPKPQPRDYRHGDKKALLRPEGGSQDIFPSSKTKGPKSYRYDSSLAPELAWDEAQARSEGERLISEILDSDSLDQARRAAEKLKNMSRSFLDWAGKAEREKISVPTLPLFVHERLSTEAVLNTLRQHKRNRMQTLDLFGEGEKSIGEKIRGAYEHMNGWQNRLILGDSLQIINSLLEYEGMGGRVQMVYMDPPYGVKYGSNFQPFVRSYSVKDGDDGNITREPEMVQAYRDTWELGVHSWLTYIRDRLLLVRELLAESGSCFVQISDENIHLIRSIMDEVFGRENFVSVISFRTSGGLGSKYLSTTGDYIIWYSKNKEVLKYRQLFVPKAFGEGTMFKNIIKTNGEDRPMNDRELQGFIDDGDRPYRLSDLVSSGLTPSCVFDFEFEGRVFRPGKNRSWKTNLQGMQTLASKNRLHAPGKTLTYRAYYHDFPVSSLTNFWTDTVGELGKSYVVQTASKIIQRCMLMTTDPGDIVFDPTCGSGTTAYVAEEWGRRWITSDVSRVPLALARQRLLTATYPYYQLRDDRKGPGAGFVYTRKQNKRGEEVGGIVPHVTLKSIANNESPAEEVLVDKPEIENRVTRISGPFCVEAVLPTPIAPDISLETKVKVSKSQQDENEPGREITVGHVERMIDILKLSPAIRLMGNQTFDLKNIRPPAKSLNLHAEAESIADGKSVAIIFGPANGAISERSVVEAGQEARNKDYSQLLVIAFAIEPAARETIKHGMEIFGLSSIYVQASTDIVMSDLLKNMRSSQIFSVCGLPDIELIKTDEKTEEGDRLWQVELRGLDVFDPASMEVNSRQGSDVPCWMLDTDYDGQCFRAGQVFFPRTSAWEKIRKAVKADFDDTVWEHLRGSISAPFIAGEQVAVKVIDDRGNELMTVKKTDAK